MNKNNHGSDADFDKELKELKDEINKEQQDVKALQRELLNEEEDLEKLEEKLEKLEKEHAHHGHGNHGHDHPHDHKLKLIFIVNGKPYEKSVKTNRTLLSIVEEVLKETGNGARPITDWTVKCNDKVLDMTKTIKELHLPECAELFLCLNAGTGGSL